MVQRHPNDSTTTVALPDGFADPSSPMFVPVELRQAFSELDDDTEQDLKKALYTEVSEPMWRTFGRRHVVVNHRSNETDFEVALCWLKIDEARRRMVRADERRSSEERSRATHTCPICRQVDATAASDAMLGVTSPCQRCRTEWERQEVAEHAARTVNGTTVAELVAAARKAATP